MIDSAANGIRIADLAVPQLSAEQKAAIQYAETVEFELSVDAVLAEAVRQTGLEDFGAEDFRERLAVQLQSVAEDPWMNRCGRMVIFNEKSLNAANRLRTVDFLRRHPEIHQREIQCPLIIAGLPRSGTTHLLNLIAADTRFRSLPYWESRQPIPDLGQAASRDHEDPRYQRCAQAWQSQDTLLPLLKNMHPMAPEHVHEEIELADADFASYTLEWIAHVPRWRDYYLRSDQRSHYEYIETMLKILSYHAGPDSWVLKSPQHLEQLPVLHSVFPDAFIVITHRDPVAVISSALTMIAYGSRLRNNTIPMQELAEYWVDRIEMLLRSCVRDRDCIPAQQRMEILFPEFMRDDLAMVRRLYRNAGISLPASAEQCLKNYLAHNPRGKYGQILYDLEGDFGIQPQRLRERFAFYYEQYPGLLADGAHSEGELG